MLFQSTCLLAALTLAAPHSPGQHPREGKPQVRLALPLTGLTSDKAERVQKGLASLTLRVYSCPHCKRSRPEAGQCPECSVALEAVELPLLGSIEVGEGRASCSLAGTAPVRLSELDAVLRRAGVTLDGTKLTIQAPATLVLRGGAVDKKGVDGVERILTGLGAFGKVHAARVTATGEVLVHVSRGSAEAPLRSAVAAALARSPELPQLADVVWGTPPAEAKAARGGRRKGKGQGEGDGKKRKGKRAKNDDDSL